MWREKALTELMPTFPRYPLKFRKAGVTRYGFKAGRSDGTFPSTRGLRLVRFVSALRAPASLRRFLVLSRGARCAGTPPCTRLVPLYPRGPRSGPGYSVPVHQHLIGPIRPTRKHICISPTRLIRDALAVRRTSSPRRPASGSVLSLAILCRHVALRDPGKPTAANTQFFTDRAGLRPSRKVSALPSPSALRFS